MPYPDTIYGLVLMSHRSNFLPHTIDVFDFLVKTKQVDVY